MLKKFVKNKCAYVIYEWSPSKIQDNFEEVDNLVLNYKIDLESLMTKRFDGNFVDMTTNFAVNCVTVKCLSRSAHLTPDFTNPDFQLSQFKFFFSF